MTRAKLNARLASSQALFDRLSVAMRDLQAAERSGNLARIGNAAFEADALACDLSDLLGGCFDAATALDAKGWDCRHAPAQPFALGVGS